MNRDYFQYQVARVWYQLYWLILLVYNLVIVSLYVISRYVHHFNGYTHTFGLTQDLIVLCGINLLYSTIVYWFVARRSLLLSVIITPMLFAFAALNGMVNAGSQPGVYLYMSGWLVSMFMAGTYGMPLLAGCILLTFSYAGLESDFRPGSITRVTYILVGSSVVVALVSYFFWRSKFTNTSDQKFTQLSGMLRNNQQQSAILIQSLGDGIIVTNTEGKITLINPAAVAMTGWPVEEATGLDVQLVAKLQKEDGADLTPEENPFALALKQPQHVNQTLIITDRNNKKITISLVVSTVTLPDSKTPVGAVAVMRDISEERAAERQRADFISTASHEMRTPVAAIEGYLALALNDKVSTVDARARNYLDKAHSSTQHLGKLFQDLLTSSKAEDGRLNNHPAVIETGAFMQQITDELRFAAEKKGLTVEFIVGKANDTIDATTKDAGTQHIIKPLYYIYADPERMREVITNLFDNACKYTDNGKISIGLTGDTEYVQLYVRDTGAGIPADDIPHLFQKFYRVDNSATRTIGGTGLGLFICRKIIELYRGRIWVESQIGKGSTFFINLPRLSSQRVAQLQNPSSDPKTVVINPDITKS